MDNNTQFDGMTISTLTKTVDEVLEDSKKAEKAVREKRNKAARERYQAYRDCGLKKTPYGWE
jgi:DNA polymerase IIIc chi subunit